MKKALLAVVGVLGGTLLAAERAASALPEDNPVADARATVTCGNARFTVLTDRLIRMEHSPDGAFEDRASFVFVNRRLPVPAFKVAHTDAGCTIDTGRLVLTYAGGAFSSESLKVEGKGACPFAWRFGDKDRGNLLGTTRTLDTVGDRSSLLSRMERIQEG